MVKICSYSITNKLNVTLLNIWPGRMPDHKPAFAKSTPSSPRWRILVFIYSFYSALSVLYLTEGFIHRKWALQVALLILKKPIDKVLFIIDSVS